MKIKRFSAGDMAAAANLIKDEFGLAAIILSQRELPQEQGGGVEITAGVRDEDMPAARAGRGGNSAGRPGLAEAPAPGRPLAGQALGAAAYRRTEAAAGGSEALRAELENLGQAVNQGLGELKNLILDLAHRQSLSEKWRQRPDLVSLYRRLLETGLAPEQARGLVESSAESARAWGGEVEEHLRKTLRPRLRLVDLSIAPPKFLALVGPSGAGKTSTLVNLAAFYRQRGLKAAAITLDTLRLGAAEQLTQYARILGLGVRVCQNHEEFREARELFETADIVLIDTPGRGFQKSEGRQDLTQYLEEAEAPVLLVLSAAMKENDLARALELARGWRKAGLVLTKFDETETLGNVIGLVMAQAPRLAFFALGPKTSEDFVMATPDKLLDLWLGGDSHH